VAVENLNERTGRDRSRILKSFSVKIKDKVFVDLFLKEGVFEKTNYATYITLGVYKEGTKIPINMDKGEASQLSLLLSQLVAEGNNADYEKLKKKYPEQESYHFY
jgi:uncharacterized protein involved in tellurium resistance